MYTITPPKALYLASCRRPRLDLVKRSFDNVSAPGGKEGSADGEAKNGEGGDQDEEGVTPCVASATPNDDVDLTSTSDENLHSRWLKAIESEEPWKDMSMVGKVFNDMSGRLGQIVIGEKVAAGDMRICFPSNMGGIAGGIKFVVKGMLLKFADPTGECAVGWW